MSALLLGLLPGLLEWAPHLLGGVGLAGTIAGFVPQLRTWGLIALAVVAVGGIGFGLLERGNYQSEKAARAADNEAAEHAALVQIERDRDKRAEVDQQYQAELARVRQGASPREQTIRSQAGGPLSAARRAYYDGVRREQANPAGGGEDRRGGAGRPRPLP